MSRRSLSTAAPLGAFLLAGLFRGIAAAAPSRAVDKDIAGIVDLFHDLQFESALKESEGLKKRYPGHPAGDFYRSVSYFERYLLEDPRSPQTLKSYEEANALCLSAAEAYRSTDTATAELYLAAGYGFHARMFAAQKQYRQAVSEAKRSFDHVNIAIRLEPERDDAYLGLGMFNYFMARIPPAAKPFAYLVTGVWGERDKGLAQLERVAKHGTAAKMEARTVLSAIYASDKEKLWDQAEPLLAELMERYPHNPIPRLRRVYTAERRRDYDAALRMADPDGAWIKQLRPEVRQKALLNARYRAAECLIFLNRAPEAAPHLKILESVPLPERLHYWVLLRRADYWKALGDADQAERGYRALKGSPPAAGSKTVMPFNDGSGLTH